jgi:hypothetical protein
MEHQRRSQRSVTSVSRRNLLFICVQRAIMSELVTSATLVQRILGILRWVTTKRRYKKGLLCFLRA